MINLAKSSKSARLGTHSDLCHVSGSAASQSRRHAASRSPASRSSLLAPASSRLYVVESVVVSNLWHVRMSADEAHKAHTKAVREGRTPDAMPHPDLLLQSGSARCQTLSDRLSRHRCSCMAAAAWQHCVGEPCAILLFTSQHGGHLAMALLSSS